MSESNLLDILLATYNGKQGISNRLVIWPALRPELITLAVLLIPIEQLRAMFQRLFFFFGNHLIVFIRQCQIFHK